MIRPGVSTFELDQLAEQIIRMHGGTPAFKGCLLYTSWLRAHAAIRRAPTGGEAGKQANARIAKADGTVGKHLELDVHGIVDSGDLIDGEPVSYTHLDVYKRQRRYRPYHGDPSAVRHQALASRRDHRARQVSLSM